MAPGISCSYYYYYYYYYYKQTHKQTDKQSGPITIHCAAASAQCNQRYEPVKSKHPENAACL